VPDHQNLHSFFIRLLNHKIISDQPLLPRAIERERGGGGLVILSANTPVSDITYTQLPVCMYVCMYVCTCMLAQIRSVLGSSQYYSCDLPSLDLCEVLSSLPAWAAVCTSLVCTLCHPILSLAQLWLHVYTYTLTHTALNQGEISSHAYIYYEYVRTLRICM
jgi:hypothetical protein